MRLQLICGIMVASCVEMYQIGFLVRLLHPPCVPNLSPVHCFHIYGLPSLIQILCNRHLMPVYETQAGMKCDAHYAAILTIAPLAR